MFEVVSPGLRIGEAKINSSSAYRGSMCFIAGVDASGYQLLQLPYTSAQSSKSFYPINKLRFEEDLSDSATAVDKLTKGDLVDYYIHGEYITDRFNKNSLGLTAAYWSNIEAGLTSTYGRKLYPKGSSTAIGTTGLKKLYVSTGPGGGHGYLWGSTVFARNYGVATSVPQFISGTEFVGIAVGVYYSDSSDAKLHFRVLPSRIGKSANF